MNFDSISPLPPLLQEVAKQTAPENYMEPYDAARVKRATELNAQVFEVDNRKPISVLNLLESTINDLGCSYSAELVYQYLLSMYNPTNNRKNFDWCNELCQKLYNIKDNVMEMILLVKRENEIRKEVLRQEKIKIEQQEAQKSRETLRAIGFMLGIIIATVVLFFAIYIPIDYHRINKNIHPITSNEKKTISLGHSGTLSVPIYQIDIPTHYYYNYKDYYEKQGECGPVKFAITNQTKLQTSSKISELERKGYKIDYKLLSDTTIWFTYDKYNIDDGRLIGNCIFMLKPSPFKLTPFPKCADENIMICCDGFGMTKSLADSIGNSLRIKWTASDSLYFTPLACKKYRTVNSNDQGARFSKLEYETDIIHQGISFRSHINWNKMLLEERYEYYSRKQNLLHSSELLLTPDMDAGILVYSSSQIERKLEDIVIEYPVNSIMVTSSVKCKIDNSDAIKTEATGHFMNKEYKYIVYQVIKDNGYSEYKEPIYGTETYYSAEPSEFAGYQYINGVQIPKFNEKTVKKERTVIKSYKNATSQKKNDDVYVCLIFGMTPEWYANNIGIIESIVNSLKIDEVHKK